MKKFLLILVLLLSARAGAQDINEVLRQIEANNLTLKALREQVEADKLGNRKGIALPDPEIEAGRLWGRPSEIGNRVDFSISQSIDLATLSGARLRAAKRRNELINLGLLTQRTAILLQAQQLYIELVHSASRTRQLQTRQAAAKELREIYVKKFESGDVNLIERNRMNSAWMTATSALSSEFARYSQLEADMRAMNGGIQLTSDGNADTLHPLAPMPLPANPDLLAAELPAGFENWLADAERRSPALQQALREAEISEKEIGLARAEGLPKLKVGYMQERTLGQRYGGVTAGLSIPLWSNRNNVRAARAAASAAQMRAADQQTQLRTKLRGLFMRAQMLRPAAELARAPQNVYDNTAMMRKALDAGEISLADYLLDRQQYYDLQDKALEAERDYHLALAELMAFEL